MAVKAKASITVFNVNDGADGDTGRGISKITEYYAVSDSNSEAPKDATPFNYIPSSTDEDGNIYGVKKGSLTTKGGTESSSYTYVTGYIPVKKGDVIRVYDGSGKIDTTLIVALYGTKGTSSNNIGRYIKDMVANTSNLYGAITIDGNCMTWDTSSISYYFWSEIAYARFTLSSADSKVTLNESGVSSWSTTAPTLTETNKYLWNYELIDYTDGTSVMTEKCVIGVYGDKGTDGNGVSSVTRYYYLAASKPSKPTTATPSSPWTATEPTYTDGSTDNLYFTDKTLYTDGTWAYGDVQLSSSYAAAKAAYQKAVAAGTKADAAAKTLSDWCSDNDTTLIDGAKIYTGSITAQQLSTDAIMSQNYEKDVAGSKLSLVDGSFDSPGLKWDKVGALTATSGTIGGWDIGDDSLSTAYEASGGTHSATFSPKDGTLKYPVLSMESASDAGAKRHINISASNIISERVTPVATYEWYLQYASFGQSTLSATRNIKTVTDWNSHGISFYITDANEANETQRLELYFDDSYDHFSVENTMPIVFTGDITASGTLKGASVTSTGAISGTDITASGTLKASGWVDCYSGFSANSTAYLKGTTYMQGATAVSARMTFSTPLMLNNNIYILTKTTGGTQCSLIGRSDGNNLWIGDYGVTGTRQVCSNAYIAASNVYKTTSSSSTSLSDRRYKSDFCDIDGASDFIMALKPRKFKFTDGTSGRYHMGFIAQDTEKTMLDTVGDTGLIVKYTTEEGQEVILDDESTYIIGIRYEEIIAPLVATVQKQQEEIDELKKRLDALEQALERR